MAKFKIGSCEFLYKENQLPLGLDFSRIKQAAEEHLESEGIDKKSERVFELDDDPNIYVKELKDCWVEVLS